MTVSPLTAMTWREIRASATEGIALCPIGSQEQHAESLPMGTDTLLVQSCVDRALELLGDDDPDVVTLPTLPFGHSPHHLFAAAVSLSADTLAAVLADVLDSLAESGFRRIMLVNGHGGNDEIMRLAVKRFALRSSATAAACSYWSLGENPRHPGHAGKFETSLMLAAQPELVRIPISEHESADQPALFDQPPYPGLTVERPGEWARVGGQTDDPSTADAATGRELLDERASALAEAIRAFHRATS